MKYWELLALIKVNIFTYTRKKENKTIFLNLGYFTHVTTLGEVQEQVLKYLAVMSRPMVMDNTHSISWTNVYADIAEIVESDWQWDEKNREQQLKRSQRYQEFLKRRSVFHGGNETEGLDFYVIPKDDESPPPPPTRKKKGGYVYPQRVADYLDYGMTAPTDDIVREIEASEERRKRVISFIIHILILMHAYIPFVVVGKREKAREREKEGKEMLM
jgi:hypothetical protein